MRKQKLLVTRFVSAMNCGIAIVAALTGFLLYFPISGIGIALLYSYALELDETKSMSLWRWGLSVLYNLALILGFNGLQASPFRFISQGWQLLMILMSLYAFFLTTQILKQPLEAK
jgi:hypothetical protein